MRVCVCDNTVSMRTINCIVLTTIYHDRLVFVIRLLSVTKLRVRDKIVFHVHASEVRFFFKLACSFSFSFSLSLCSFFLSLSLVVSSTRTIFNCVCVCACV